MPVHEWNRVYSGIFHDFHQRWIVEISRSLNGGLLPSKYYALTEQVAEGPHPDVVTLERSADDRIGPSPSGWSPSGGDEPAVGVADCPPQVSHIHEAHLEIYADLASHVAIRHVSDDEIVGFIEITSPGNKHNNRAFEKFGDKVHLALHHGIHCLVIDPHRPTPRDPDGFHAAFSHRWLGEESPPGVTAQCPLGLSAFQCNGAIVCYFEPVAVGDRLIDMPAFLTSNLYVNVPLEQTYMSAWQGVPDRWKQVIEG